MSSRPWVNRGRKRLVFWVHGLPGSFWRTVFQRITLARSRRVELHGFVVWLCGIAEPEQHAVVERISAALQLLGHHDERRFERMRQDCNRLLVKEAEGTSYWVSTNVCVLGMTDVVKRSPSMLALALVHEATHARITGAAIFPWRHAIGRMERLCVKAQVAFTMELRAAGYGGTDRVLAWLRESEATRWWTPEVQYARRLASLEKLGVPAWGVRVWKLFNRV